jgi:hypothetical protein
MYGVEIEMKTQERGQVWCRDAILFLQCMLFFPGFSVPLSFQAIKFCIELLKQCLCAHFNLFHMNEFLKLFVFLF